MKSWGPMSAAMTASSSSTVSANISTMPGHHARLCHQTFARTGGWQGHTQPSCLSRQAAAAPSSLCPTPSHTGMTADMVTALCGTPGFPGAGHAWGLAAGLGCFCSHKATWIWDGTLLGACRSWHCLERSFGICFQPTRGPWRTQLPDWRRCQARRGTCRMEERRCPAAQASGGAARGSGGCSPTPCLPETHWGVSQDVLTGHSLGPPISIPPCLAGILQPPCFSPRATFVLLRGWILAGRCWTRWGSCRSSARGCRKLRNGCGVTPRTPR